MGVLYGAIAGLVAGFVAGIVVAIVQLTAKRMRNARIMKRGGAGYKDCVLVPLWFPAGAIGGVLGAIAGGIWSTWPAAAIAGAALPALYLVIALVVTVQQSRDVPVCSDDRRDPI